MRWFQGAVVLVAAAHFCNMLANSRLFEKFAFGDNGWPLVVDSLLDQHLKPVHDFGYFYGLLTLLLDRAVFALLGRTPDAVIAIDGTCSMIVAFNMARLVRIANLRFFPALFLVTTAALSAIPRGFPSPAHGMEAALLMTALTEQAKGRLNRSLVFTVLAVFFKPSLGYIYGLILLILIFTRPGRVRNLLPAVITGAAVLTVLVACFGAEAVLATQIPTSASGLYSLHNFGFFGSGKPFWLPDDERRRNFDYYFGGVFGIWMAATLVLAGTGLVLAMRILVLLISAATRRSSRTAMLARAGEQFRDPITGFVATCAVLHLVFVLLLFGTEFSWIYYPYLLFSGCAVGLNLWPRKAGTAAALLLAIVCVYGQYEWLWRRDAWTRNNTKSPDVTAGLPAPPDIVNEWAAVRAIAARYPDDREKVLVLTRVGAPQFLAPELDGPHWWGLFAGFTGKEELDKARAQILKAEWIVTPAGPDWSTNEMIKWDPLREVLAPFAEVRTYPNAANQETKFNRIKLYRRVRPG